MTGRAEQQRPVRSLRDEDAVQLFARRTGPARELAGQAGAVAAACHAMAVRFQQGGKLVVFGSGTTDVATVTGVAECDGMANIFAYQIGILATPTDIALGISADGNGSSVLGGLIAAKDKGLLTIALVGGRGGAIAASPAVDHLLTAGSSDPRVVKELQVTTYHVLWELVHVFFEQPGVLGPGVVA